MAAVVIGESERICSRCGVAKPANLEFFSLKRPDRLNARCKPCVSEIGRLRWADPDYHAKQIAKRAIKYREPAFQEKERLRQEKRNTDPDHIASEVARQKRRSSDPEYQKSELLRGRRRRESPVHRARVSEYGKKWYAANFARQAKKGQAWYLANREKVREKRNSPLARHHTNKWLRKHLKKNPHLRVIRNVAVAVSEILKEGRISGSFRFLPYKQSGVTRTFRAPVCYRNDLEELRQCVACGSHPAASFIQD